MTEKEKEKVDYLEVDDPIPGQNWVCLSFISPESLMESKEGFKVAKFLQAYCKDKDMDVSKTMKDYEDYIYKYSEELQRDLYDGMSESMLSEISSHPLITIGNHSETHPLLSRCSNDQLIREINGSKLYLENSYSCCKKISP